MTLTTPATTTPQLPKPLSRRARRLLVAPFLAFVQLLRLLLRKTLWALIRVVRFAWRHLLVTVLLALGLYFGYRALVPQAQEGNTQTTVQVAPVIAPPPSIQAYLDAQRNFDADRMWQTLSPEAKARRLASGETLATFRSSIQLLQQQGFRFGDSKYVGGYRLPDGQAYYFYVTQISTNSGQTGWVYQIFWVNTDGRIILADTPQLQ